MLVTNSHVIHNLSCYSRALMLFTISHANATYYVSHNLSCYSQTLVTSFTSLFIIVDISCRSESNFNCSHVIHKPLCYSQALMLVTTSHVIHKPLCYSQALMLFTSPCVIHKPLCYSQALVLFTSPYVIHKPLCYSQALVIDGNVINNEWLNM